MSGTTSSPLCIDKQYYPYRPHRSDDWCQWQSQGYATGRIRSFTLSVLRMQLMMIILPKHCRHGTFWDMWQPTPPEFQVPLFSCVPYTDPSEILCSKVGKPIPIAPYLWALGVGTLSKLRGLSRRGWRWSNGSENAHVIDVFVHTNFTGPSYCTKRVTKVQHKQSITMYGIWDYIDFLIPMH